MECYDGEVQPYRKTDYKPMMMIGLSFKRYALSLPSKKSDKIMVIQFKVHSLMMIYIMIWVGGIITSRKSRYLSYRILTPWFDTQPAGITLSHQVSKQQESGPVMAANPRNNMKNYIQCTTTLKYPGRVL